MKVEIKAIEYYLPSKKENNAFLKKDNPNWSLEDIEMKTGIKIRYVTKPNETALDLALHAAEKLFNSRMRKEEIDFLILITQSPDYVLPTSACILQDRLKLKKSCMAFDVNLGCSGFIYGLAIGSSLIDTSLAEKGLLICSETYTKYISKSDRTCRPLFSDGAVATLLTASKFDSIGPFDLGTDGSGFQELIVPSSGARISKSKNPGRIFMDGAKVFMFTMEMVPKSITNLLKKSDKTIDDIDLFIFHQASKVVIDNIIRRLNLPKEKVFVNYHRVGNVVSASIPIALKDAIKEKHLKNGSLIMLVGFGVGYSWGSCLIKWGHKS